MNASEFLSLSNWVVVGDVLNDSKYAYKILAALKSNQYKVEGVNPKAEEGQCYRELKDVPYEIEVLDLCIHPKRGIDIVKAAKDLGIKNILIQPGAESEEILSYCSENSLNAIQGCALVELRKQGKIS